MPPVDRLIEFATNHWMMIGSLLIVLVLIAQDMVEGALRKYKPITALRTVELMNQHEDCLVIDVREPDEYAKGHIDGARLLTLNRVKDRIHELEQYKNKPVVVVCQSGTRSPEACKILIQHGHGQVFNLAGGMIEWEDCKLPVTSKKNK